MLHTWGKSFLSLCGLGLNGMTSLTGMASLMLCWYGMPYTWWGKSNISLRDLRPDGEAMEKITSIK